jgi:hypothetical protein
MHIRQRLLGIDAHHGWSSARIGIDKPVYKDNINNQTSPHARAVPRISARLQCLIQDAHLDPMCDKLFQGLVLWPSFDCNTWIHEAHL